VRATLAPTLTDEEVERALLNFADDLAALAFTRYLAEHDDSRRRIRSVQ
jgi:hypothetical protein